MHDEMRIRLPVKFDAMFLRRGFYLFLNTTKPDKRLFFLLTNLHLKVFDLNIICSYFLSSIDEPSYPNKENILHSFNIFDPIYLHKYHGFMFFFKGLFNT